MKKVKTAFTLVVLLSVGIYLGFSNISDKLADKSPKLTKSGNEISHPVKTTDLNKNTQSDGPGISYQTHGTPYYTDNFDGANDTTSLKARGYLVYYRGGGTQGAAATWFQGNSGVFAAYNGPATGYVAANFQVVTGANDIDSWLVLPKQNVSVGDSLFFYNRGGEDTGPPPTWPDSIRVMYSTVGDSTPEAATWVELGRFEANVNGVWQKYGFAAPTAGTNARFAIRYAVVDGGPSGLNSNYTGFDALTIEAPPIAADVGVESITDPTGTIVLPTAAVTPTAVIKNFGTSPQSFNVTMTINPGGYSSTQTVTSLGAGASINVDFASHSPSAGVKTVRVYSQLASDGNRLNDTVQTTYSAYNPHYGGAGVFNASSYYFANSTPDASLAPSQPGYCWIDTTGSTSLAVNSAAAVALTNGTLDDGHWGILLGTPRKIKFMGVTYDSIYIGTNGILGFVNFVPGSGNWYPPANGLPGEGSGGLSRPAIYPLWNDMNWGNASQPINRLSYKIDNYKNNLIITYDRAPLFGGASSDWVSFQVCIALQADTAGAPNSNIVISWSNLSTAINLPILAGIQNATGSEWLQYAFYGGSVTTLGTLFDTLGAGVSVAFGPNDNNLGGHCKELNLTSMFEAYWDGTTYLGDTITVEIRSGVSPFALLETHKVTNDASGFAAIDVGINNNTNYYIVVNHRNTVRTWSQLVQWTGQKLSYDFTSAQTMAFGNNLTLKAGRWCIYTGDITKDGVVDGADGAFVDNDASNFVSGPYVLSDLNWDTVVDGADATYTDNNSSNFIGEIAP
ncbi:MAG: hypothetical protein HGGPFJEG_01147 [Ignavibacteria bacterium]|nr:hypothetical protein [Ignavibacteria bacterium]